MMRVASTFDDKANGRRWASGFESRHRIRCEGAAETDAALSALVPRYERQ